VIRGIELLCRVDHRRFVPAVVLMTDGKSNTGSTLPDLDRAYRKCGKDIPVFPIQFGSAEEKQLRDIAGLTRGKVFDGRKDLIHTFREVRAYH
jgi:Ca-activated chloride channel family protein